MSMGRKRRGEFLEGRLCTELWAELGSLNKVSLALEKQGIINPATQKRATPMGIRVAAGRWMCSHPLETRGILAKIPGNEWVNDDNKFSEYLVKLAVTSLGKKEFRLFLNKYQLHDIYENVRKLPIPEDEAEDFQFEIQKTEKA